MDNANLLPSHKTAILGVVNADNYAVGTVTTAWVDMSLVYGAMGILNVGDIAATGTVDAKLEQATDAAGTGAKDITGKAIAQLTQAGGDSNKQALINLRQEELDTNNSFTHARLSISVGAAAADLSGLVTGHSPINGPADQHNAATVAEVIE